MAFLSSRAGTCSWFFVALALLLGSGSAHAQSNGDGSVYSRFGLGTLQDFSSSQSAALGRGGYALRSLNYTSTANPALWSDQVFTRLSGGAYYQNIQSTSGEGQSSELAAGTLEALQFSFPIYSRSLGVTLSFQPYTQYNYRTRRSSSLPVQVTPDNTADASYQVNFRGSGGLHRFRGGLGYEIADALRVGASLDVLFGIVENQRNTEFGQAAPLRNIRLKDATRLSGVGGTIGAHLALADVLSTGDNLSVGGAVTLPATLTGDRVLTLTESQSVAPDTVSVGGQSSVDGSVSLPLRSRLGVAYQPNSRWTFTADGVFEPWSSFSSTFSQRGPLSRFPVGGEQTLTDRWRVSLGTEVLPAGSDQFSGYLANVAYRLGAYTEQLYVQPDGRTNVQMYAVTAGFSLPTSIPGTRIDLNLETGTRGSTDGALVRDNFYRVGLHVNFGERWFQERRLR